MVVAEGPNAEPEINYIDWVDIEIKADFFKKHTKHIENGANEKQLAPPKSDNDIMTNKTVYENEKDVPELETITCQDMVKEQCSMSDTTDDIFNCHLKNDITPDFDSETIINHIENKDENDKITRTKANLLSKGKKRKKQPDDTGQGLKFASDTKTFSGFSKTARKSLLLVFSFYCMVCTCHGSNRACAASSLTMRNVKDCPKTEQDWINREKQMKCQNVQQNCTEPENFRYHCVSNEWGNGAIEVCAEVWRIVCHCPEYNNGTGIMQNDDNRPFPQPFENCDFLSNTFNEKDNKKYVDMCTKKASTESIPDVLNMSNLIPDPKSNM